MNDKDYFISNLPVISTKWSKGKKKDDNLPDIREAGFNYNKEPYFAMIAGMYVASYLCGISLIYLTDKSTPNLIKSIAKHHLYYQTRKFMKNPSLLDKYDLSGAKKHIPIKYIEFESTARDGDGNHFMIKQAVEYSDSDYKSFICYSGDGLTVIGEALLQESVESYVYSKLGAQARSRWSIVSKGAKSTQTQYIFRKIVEDTIIQSDVTITISNMRRSIVDTNVTLNTAISQTMILVPSSMVILKKPIPGYNNILTTANKDMKFGVNSMVNYVGVKKKSEDKKVHQPDTPSSHLDSIDDSVRQPTNNKSLDDGDEKRRVMSRSDSHSGDLLALFGLTAVVSLAALKYYI